MSDDGRDAAATGGEATGDEATGGAGDRAGGGRTVLMLQGPSSLFFSRLGDALAARGARVLRINLCPGDVLFWRRGGAASYRGTAADWPAFVGEAMAREGVTDLVLLGADRAGHRAAIAEAHARGVRVHHVELGYFRPDWLTLEPDGGGGHSRFPRDRAAIEALANGPPPDATRMFRSSFLGYAAMDVAWNLANVAAGWATHPHFRHHAIWHPLAEYAGFVWTRLRAPAERRRAARVWRAWRATPGPLFLFPLQLRTDFQIRVHGPDPDLRVTARAVVASFAANAPGDARLLVKEHPVDNGLTPWRRLLGGEAVRRGVGGRVEVVDGGDLDAMIAAATGVVTVNSTVGLAALMAGRPVKTLGAAVFDREGLTDPQPLDAFWTAPTPPDAARVKTFARALAWATQLRGAFDGEGAAPGAAAMADRILAPPRLPSGPR